MRKDERIDKEAAQRMCTRGVLSLFLLFTLLLLGSASVFAIEIPTGNEDVVLRWDNTLRYTLMYRLKSADDALLKSPNYDDGNRNFDKGFVSNRLDVLSEADLTFKKNYGVRVSGAFWYDQQYKNSFDNDSVATSNYFKDGVQQVNGLYKNAERYYAGPYGELLDAFAFAKVDAGNVPLFFKLGRHVYSWGQSLLNPINGISYAQMPLDMGKATANPGIEVKELFRPTNMASVVAQVTPQFQLAGQYYLQWERNRLPLEGTYFGTSDVSLDGDGYMLLYGFPVRHGRDIEAEKNKDFGLAVQWSPASLNDTTFGLYYRKFSDRMPTLILNANGSMIPSNFTYHVAYQSDIDLYGVSYAGNILGLSVGAEVSYRHNMPLISSPALVPLDSYLPDDGKILGATGDTLHALVNVMGLLKKTPLWDAGTWVVEFDYNRWMKVGDDAYHVFKGADSYAGFDRVTRDAAQATINFTPQYLQILPGLDLDVPLTVTCGLWGVSSVTGGGGEGDGNFGIGLNFTYLTNYKLNFNYAHYFGRLGEDPVAGAVAKGSYGLMRDRDFISMTFKFSF